MIFCTGVFILVYSFFFQLSVVVDECRCSGEGVEFPDVEESEVGLYVCPDVVFVADGEVEVDDGEVFRPGLHDGEEGRGEDVEPGEGVEVVFCAVGRVEVLWERAMSSGCGERTLPVEMLVHPARRISLSKMR